MLKRYLSPKLLCATQRVWLMSALTLAGLASVFSPASASTSHPPNTVAHPSSTPVPALSWRSQLIGAGPTRTVKPKAVIVLGDAAGVKNPKGLLDEGGPSTELSSSIPRATGLLLDMGINTGGIVEVGVTSLSANGQLRVSYSEARKYMADTGDYNSAPRSDDITSAGPFRSPGTRGGTRWIQLQLEKPGSATIDYVRVVANHYLPSATDYTGHFYSSDATLNKIYYASAYSLATNGVPTKLDELPRSSDSYVFVDGNKRDRQVWQGDLAVEAPAAMSTFRQGSTIVKNSLALLQCQQDQAGLMPATTSPGSTCPTSPPASAPFASLWQDYTLFWMVAVHDYYLYTGDDEFVRAAMPALRRVINYYSQPAQTSGGLYSSCAACLNWHPFSPGVGIDTNDNSVFYTGLMGAADLEDRFGSARAAAADRAHAKAIRTALHAQLWDAKEGAFYGNLSSPSPSHWLDGNSQAIASGIATPDEAQRILAFVNTKLRSKYGDLNTDSNTDPFMDNYISPFAGSIELAARVRARDISSAVDLLHREWGYLIAQDPGTIWEKINTAGGPATYVPGQSDSTTGPATDPVLSQFFLLGAGATSLDHGWGTGTITALTQGVLGIRPTAPGYAQWAVDPQVGGGVRFAQGAAAAPNGRQVISRWQVGAGDGTFKLTASGPVGTVGAVSVPLLGQDRDIERDGQLVWSQGRPESNVHARRVGDTVVFLGQTGLHTFAWQSSRSFAPAMNDGKSGVPGGPSLATTGPSESLVAEAFILVCLAGALIRAKGSH